MRPAIAISSENQAIIDRHARKTRRSVIAIIIAATSTIIMTDAIITAATSLLETRRSVIAIITAVVYLHAQGAFGSNPVAPAFDKADLLQYVGRSPGEHFCACSQNGALYFDSWRHAVSISQG